MRAFWIDPASPSPGSSSVPAEGWEAAAQAALPSARCVVRPLSPTFIIVGTAQGAAAIRAHWGLVPPGTKADARRSTAIGLTGVPTKVLRQAPVEALWSSTARSWRCIVPVTGWIADVQGQATACKPPGQRVALAGVFSRFENAEGKVVRTFGLVTAWRENDERFGHQGPIAFDSRDAEAWLRVDAERARTMLACRQPPVEERGIRRPAKPPLHFSSQY